MCACCKCCHDPTKYLDESEISELSYDAQDSVISHRQEEEERLSMLPHGPADTRQTV